MGMGMGGYIGLFTSSFLAATLIPLSSEAVLAGLSATEGYDIWTLWMVATVGNTLGACVNWLLGGWCAQGKGKTWFPIKEADINKAERWFQKWGVWSLLLSWVPIIGDPITVAAGFLRVRFELFIGLVLAAKGARYAVILMIMQNYIL